MLKVLILYHYKSYPLRATVKDNLYAPQHYSTSRCYHVNFATRGFPAYLAGVEFDLILIHSTLLNLKWDPPRFLAAIQTLAPLRDQSCPKIAMPQDEYVHGELIERFCLDLGVTHLFSVAPPAEWPRIYPRLSSAGIQFDRLLTGYVDPLTLGRIARLSAANPTRDVDIGYRSWHPQANLGRFAWLRLLLTQRFRARAPEFGLKVDLSTEQGDTFFGDDWYRFLLRCKYVLGVEGGASILDPDGSLAARTREYLASHPGAPFEAIEAECFPGREGTLALKALSPRHLEACATRSCQILIRGDFNGILEAGRHYLPLDEDFGNLDEVLEQVRRDDLREAMVERAWQDVIASGKYTFERYVEHLLGVVPPGSRRIAPGDEWARLRCRIEDILSWAVVTPLAHWYNFRAWLKLRLPAPVVATITGLLRMLRTREAGH
ncbi:MAG: hypothetical protein FJZ01_05315 [Candidatus Sericytochromatia bacterium]|nr:hypothetical protein [Candidatus Tanganyikabacteria bacterium]